MVGARVSGVGAKRSTLPRSNSQRQPPLKSASQSKKGDKGKAPMVSNGRVSGSDVAGPSGVSAEERARIIKKQKELESLCNFLASPKNELEICTKCE
jgi:hypothetical protein